MTSRIEKKRLAKLVTFKSLSHIRSIKDVEHQLARLDTQTNKIMKKIEGKGSIVDMDKKGNFILNPKGSKLDLWVAEEVGGKWG